MLNEPFIYETKTSQICNYILGETSRACKTTRNKRLNTLEHSGVAAKMVSVHRRDPRAIRLPSYLRVKVSTNC